MGGQFWSAFISCDAQFHDAVQLFLEQIDVIRQMVAKYPDDLMWAVSSDDIQAAISSGKIASLIGVESGHAIGSSLAMLRTLYEGGSSSKCQEQQSFEALSNFFVMKGGLSNPEYLLETW